MFDWLSELPNWAQIAVSAGLIIGVSIGAVISVVLVFLRYFNTHNVSVLNGSHAKSIDDVALELARLTGASEMHETILTERHIQATDDRGKLFELARKNENNIGRHDERINAIGTAVGDNTAAIQQLKRG